MLTFLPLEEIDKMDSWEGAQLNEAKEILAFELTKMVHGEEEAAKAKEASKALFAGGGNLENMPSVTVTDDMFRDGTVDLISILVAAKLVPTRSEGRRTIEQGGCTVNDEKITDFKKAYTKEEIASGDLIVRKGKKNFCKVVL
jgi:tyrosyl-tRNA synthetase